MKKIIDEKVFLERMENEEENFKYYKQSSSLGRNILAGPVVVDSIKNLREWGFVIHGREGSLWEGALIKGSIKFPEEYPLEPPVALLTYKGFQHIHVYSDGRICLPLLSKISWDPSTEIFFILLKVEELIHNDPNPSSPANKELLDIYLEDRAKYEDIIKTQTLKLV